MEKQDFIAELICKGVDEEYSDTQIAEDIRQAIKERRPKAQEEKVHAGYEFSLTGREYNQALEDYDKVLGIGGKK
jgi:hypothetical protein